MRGKAFNVANAGGEGGTRREEGGTQRDKEKDSLARKIRVGTATDQGLEEEGVMKGVGGDGGDGDG